MSDFPPIEQAASDLIKLLASSSSEGNQTLPLSDQVGSAKLLDILKQVGMTTTQSGQKQADTAINEYPTPMDSNQESPVIVNQSAIEVNQAEKNTEKLVAETVKSLKSSLYGKEEDLRMAQSEFMGATQKLVVEQGKVTKLTSEIQAKQRELTEYEAKIVRLRSSIGDAERQRSEAQANVSTMCENIEKGNKQVQLLKSEIGLIEAQLSTLPSIEPESSTVGFDDLKARDVESRREESRHHHSENPTATSYRSTIEFTLLPPKADSEVPTCLMHNLGKCALGENCQYDHECAYCRSRNHTFPECHRRPQICSFFGTDGCQAQHCVRQVNCSDLFSFNNSYSIAHLYDLPW